MSDKFAAGIKAGSTSVSVPVVLRKTADNTENTGTVAAGVTAYYWRQGGTPTVLTAITDLAAITTAWAAGGWKAADGTNQPGAYRLDVDDAAFATGDDWVVISVKVASCYVFYEKYPLTTNVVQTGDSFGVVKSGGTGDTAAIQTTVTENGADVDELITTIGVAGAGLTAVGLANGAIVTATFGTCDFTSTMKTSLQTAADAAITANVTVIEVNADVDELIATIGVAGAGLTAVALANGSIVTATFGSCDFTATMKTSLQTAADAAITANVTVIEIGADVDEIVAKLPANAIADETLVIAATNAIITAVGTPMQAGATVAVTSNIKTNQALAKFQFGMTDATTHAPKTLLTVTCTRSIDGGAFAAGTLANVAEVANGDYVVDFGAGDLNGKVIVLRATAAGADDTFERIITQP